MQHKDDYAGKKCEENKRVEWKTKRFRIDHRKNKNRDPILVRPNDLRKNSWKSLRR